MSRNYWMAGVAGLVLLPAVMMGATRDARFVTDLKGEDLATRIASDRKSVEIYRQGMQSVVEFMRSRPDLFPPAKLAALRTLNREASDEIWGAWKRFADYSVAVSSTRRFHGTALLLKDKRLKEDSFAVTYAAFLAHYRFAMEFIRLADNDEGLDVLLNDAVPELGLPKGSYAKLKLSVLNAARATEFGALNVTAAALPKRSDDAAKAAEEDKAAIWKFGAKEGPQLTAENAWDVVRLAAGEGWLPVQTGVAIWMGDTKVWRKDECLITQDQIREAAPRLEPGDVVLERREWFMSNVGLPGFWPHATIFIGTAELRKKYFDDPEVAAWVRQQGQADGSLEGLLQSRYPQFHANSLRPLEDGHVPRILEAVGEGVIFSTLEHSAAADSVAALRPRLTKKEKAVALFRAFRYCGRPYDYNFDFTTDSAIVCSELVYKAYQACPDSRGLTFPMQNILGRLAMPANVLVKRLDETYGTPQQEFDMVLFLDGNEKERRAQESTVEELRKSWQRPKWHVITQDLPAGK